MRQRTRFVAFASLVALAVAVFLLAPDSGRFARVPFLVLLVAVAVLYQVTLADAFAPHPAQPEPAQVDDDLRTVIDLTEVVDLTTTTDAGHAPEGERRDPAAPLRADPPVTDDDGDDEAPAGADAGADVDAFPPDVAAGPSHRAGYFDLTGDAQDLDMAPSGPGGHGLRRSRQEDRGSEPAAPPAPTAPRAAGPGAPRHSGPSARCASAPAAPTCRHRQHRQHRRHTADRAASTGTTPPAVGHRDRRPVAAVGEGPVRLSAGAPLGSAQWPGSTQAVSRPSTWLSRPNASHEPRHMLSSTISASL